MELSASVGTIVRMVKTPQQFRPTRIREWRKHRKLSLEKLAERLDGIDSDLTTASGLSMLERGQRGYTQATIEKIAEVLQTDVISLLTGDPKGDEAAIWGLWRQAAPAERRTLIDVAEAIIKGKQ